MYKLDNVYLLSTDAIQLTHGGPESSVRTGGYPAPLQALESAGPDTTRIHPGTPLHQSIPPLKKNSDYKMVKNKRIHMVKGFIWVVTMTT